MFIVKKKSLLNLKSYRATESWSGVILPLGGVSVLFHRLSTRGQDGTLSRCTGLSALCHNRALLLTLQLIQSVITFAIRLEGETSDSKCGFAQVFDLLLHSQQRQQHFKTSDPLYRRETAFTNGAVPGR